MRLAPSPLEDWLRDYYFDASIDISSSGVEPYTLGAVFGLLDVDPAELTGVSLRDSRTAGVDELRELVARRYSGGDPAKVIVTHGSTEAQLLVLVATLRAGDEVVVLEPAYHTLVSTAAAIGCRIVRWWLRPEERFRPDLDELGRLVTTRTAMIVVNFPHNPTGVTLSHAEQRELVRIADHHGCALFWDGVFEDLVYDEPPLPPVSTLYERGHDFGTLSKAFGLPGLRVGWAMCPKEVIRAAVTVRDYTTLALSPVVEFIAGHVLAAPDRLLGPRLRLAAGNRAIVTAWLDEHCARVSATRPQAGVVVFPLLTGCPDTVDLCHRLLRTRGVLLVPGDCFGLPGHVRLGFGGDTDRLRLGLAALAEALPAGRDHD